MCMCTCVLCVCEAWVLMALRVQRGWHGGSWWSINDFEISFFLSRYTCNLALDMISVMAHAWESQYIKNSQNWHSTLQPQEGPCVSCSWVKTLQIPLTHHHVWYQGQPRTHGVAGSNSLFFTLNNFDAVRRTDPTKPTSFFSCFKALVCFHKWRTVAVLKNARILLSKIHFALKSARVKSYKSGKTSIL